MHDLVVPDEAVGFSPPGCEPGITSEEVKSGKGREGYFGWAFACFYVTGFALYDTVDLYVPVQSIARGDGVYA